MRALLLALALLALVLPRALAAPQAGSEPQVGAFLSSGVVKLGDRVTMVVRVENAGDARMATAPEVDGLLIGSPQGPRVNVSEQWFNGRRTRTTQHEFLIPVQPARTGDFVIPSVAVTVDGRTRGTPELALTVVEDLQGAELGLLEIRPSTTRVVEGQPFTVEVVFGVDAAIGQRVNYVNLSLPWWGQLPGVLELEPEPGISTQRASFDLNATDSVPVDRLENRTVRGREFLMFSLKRSFLPTRVGTLEFPTSFAEFGEVDERRDFFRSRRVKIETWYVRAPDVQIEVAALPEEGRPLDFGGALGQIVAEASAEPRDVDAGDSIKLTVEWTGQGNLEFFAPPDLDRLPAFRDFRVYGMTEEVKRLDRRRVTYDLAPLTSEVTEIPAVPLPVYDPQLGSYTIVETRPLAVRVRALENPIELTAEGEDRRFERDVRDIVARPGEGGERDAGGPGTAVIGGLLAATPLLWLGLRVLGRRGRDPDAPLERRRRRARRELARALAAADGPKAELDALNAFLAARTRERDQAWLGRADRIAALGLEAGAADELAALVAELESGAYGGGAAVGRERVLATADRLVQEGL